MQAQSQKVSLPGEVKEVLLNNQKAVGSQKKNHFETVSVYRSGDH